MHSLIDPASIREDNSYEEDPEIILNENFISEGEVPDVKEKLFGDRVITLEQAAELGAVDGDFFSHYFFPKTSRQDSAPFHPDIWELIDNPVARYISLQVFRGGAKTSLLRLATARRIGYGLSNTILYIGKSEGHAVRSVEWLKRNIEFNPIYSNAFGLEKGTPWTTGEVDVRHTTLDMTIRVLAMGIEGSVRGVNVDDYRPDLIVLDDVIDEDNAGTADRIKKINELIFGAVKESLAPSSENPHAKMIMLQTPINQDDASELTQNDPDWHPMKISVFTDEGESAWPHRWTTEELIKEKQSAARRQMLSLWLREKECVVTSDEKRYFSWGNVRFWDLLPEHVITTAIGIDPSPPNDEEDQSRRKKDPDPEVVSAVGIWGIKHYVLEYKVIVDPDPEKTYATMKHYARKWKCGGVGVETVAYQKTLKWYLEKRMREERWHIPIHKIDKKVAKKKRLRQRFVYLSVDKELYVHPTMQTFKNQYTQYPDVPNDDVLDSIDLGFEALLNYEMVGWEDEEDDYEEGSDMSDYINHAP